MRRKCGRLPSECERVKAALDSSVILDVITDDPCWGDASEEALKKILAQGALLIGECVLAEITPVLGEGQLEEFLKDWRIQFVPSSRNSAIAAGRMFEKYLRRGGTQKRVLPDFLIGAHAAEAAGCLIARDRGYFRDYFKDLRVMDPGAKVRVKDRE